MSDVDVGKVDLASGVTPPHAEVGDAAGEPVVFVHAYVESWRYFERVLGLLPASIHGHAPTQRGHGDADKPARGYLPDDFAADIVGFMDALAIDSAVLVGSSSGGLVSQVVASTHPERISALVLLSGPAHLGDKPVVRQMWEEVHALEDPVDQPLPLDEGERRPGRPLLPRIREAHGRAPSDRACEGERPARASADRPGRACPDPEGLTKV